MKRNSFLQNSFYCYNLNKPDQPVDIVIFRPVSIFLFNITIGNIYQYMLFSHKQPMYILDLTMFPGRQFINCYYMPTSFLQFVILSKAKAIFSEQFNHLLYTERSSQSKTSTYHLLLQEYFNFDVVHNYDTDMKIYFCMCMCVCPSVYLIVM